MESAQRQKKLWAESTDEAMEKVQEAGVKVVEPELTPFREKVDGLYDSYAEQFPKVYELVEKIRDVH